jgi:hypothetical protein
VDVTAAAGLRWGIRRLTLRGWNVVETMGGGGGFVEYDGDGWLDVYLVSYSTRVQEKAGRPVGDALYRNNRDGTFSDVTSAAGITGLRRGTGLAVGGLRQRRAQRRLRVGLRHECSRGTRATVASATAAPGWGSRSPPSRSAATARFLDCEPGRDRRESPVSVAGHRRLRALVGGASYLTASDKRLLFGLGGSTSVDKLEVRWPSGRQQILTGPLAVDRYLVVRDPLSELTPRASRLPEQGGSRGP